MAAEGYGPGRVANRDPSYSRGPGDPAGTCFRVGLRFGCGASSCAIRRRTTSSGTAFHTTFLPKPVLPKDAKGYGTPDLVPS